MINRKQTQKNVIFSVGNVVISGIALFVLYKYLLNKIGIEQIGVWSLIISFSSIVRLGDLGFASSMVKFISTYKAQNDTKKMISILETGATTLLFFSVILSIILYLLALYFLPKIISFKNLYLAYEILPYSIASFVIMSIAGVFLSSLDGLQRIDIKLSIVIIGVLFNLIFSILFVNLYGFVGLGYVQVAQGILVFLLGWFMIRKHMDYTKFIPFAWNKTIFKEILGYSIHLQATSLLTLLVEPLVKIFLTNFGTFAMVGYFDMAYKFIMQFRAILVNANQVIVSVVADLHERDKSHIATLYRDSFKIVFYSSIFLYSLVAIAVPLVSYLWIGHLETVFMSFSYMILPSILVNTVSGSAYFSNMGIGLVHQNTIAMLLMGILNAICGYILGYFYSGYGVVAGYSISVIISSIYVVLNFNKMLGMPLNTLLSAKEMYYMMKISTTFFLFMIFMKFFEINSLGEQFVLLFLSLMFIIILSKDESFCKAFLIKLKDKIKK